MKNFFSYVKYSITKSAVTFAATIVLSLPYFLFNSLFQRILLIEQLDKLSQGIDLDVPVTIKYPLLANPVVAILLWIISVFLGFFVDFISTKISLSALGKEFYLVPDNIETNKLRNTNIIKLSEVGMLSFFKYRFLHKIIYNIFLISFSLPLLLVAFYSAALGLAFARLPFKFLSVTIEFPSILSMTLSWITVLFMYFLTVAISGYYAWGGVFKFFNLSLKTEQELLEDV